MRTRRRFQHEILEETPHSFAFLEFLMPLEDDVRLCATEPGKCTHDSIKGLRRMNRCYYTKADYLARGKLTQLLSFYCSVAILIYDKYKKCIK